MWDDPTKIRKSGLGLCFKRFNINVLLFPTVNWFIHPLKKIVSLHKQINRITYYETRYWRLSDIQLLFISEGSVKGLRITSFQNVTYSPMRLG